MPFNDIIDLEKYPLDQQGTAAYTRLVQRLSDELKQNQICTLPDFMLDSCRYQELESVRKALPDANPARSYRNVYLERMRTDGLDDDHPRNILSEASYRMIGAHILSPDSALKKLYYWPCFQRFVADITGQGTLYPSDDPYQPVNVLCHEPGDQSAWHFDSSNAFTMTLMLQAPENGGAFELVPDIRSADDPNLTELSEVLRGDRTKVKTFERDEGSLVIFRGCHSAHRVTKIEGTRPRFMCVMVYEDKPGVMGDPVVNETVYGVKATG
jgi:hypothetical protein